MRGLPWLCLGAGKGAQHVLRTINLGCHLGRSYGEFGRSLGFNGNRSRTAPPVAAYVGYR